MVIFFVISCTYFTIYFWHKSFGIAFLYPFIPNIFSHNLYYNISTYDLLQEKTKKSQLYIVYLHVYVESNSQLVEYLFTPFMGDISKRKLLNPIYIFCNTVCMEISMILQIASNCILTEGIDPQGLHNMLPLLLMLREASKILVAWKLYSVRYYPLSSEL